jgi:hypothetical protein
LEAQGHVIPPIPVVFVKAKDKGEVKQLLLECDSRYGAVTKQSALNFIGDLSVDFSNLSIPDAGTLTFDDLSIDIDSFFENSDYTREKKIKLCPHCGKPI